MKKKVLIALLIGNIIGMAQAQWNTTIKDDLFAGKKAIMIGKLNNDSVLYFECQRDQLPTLAFLLPEKDAPRDLNIPVDLVIKVDDKDIIQGDGTIQRRNDYYIHTYADNIDLFHTLKDIRDAQQKILVGYQIKGTNANDSFSGNVRGSTASVNQFIKACNLNLPQ